MSECGAEVQEPVRRTLGAPRREADVHGVSPNADEAMEPERRAVLRGVACNAGEPVPGGRSVNDKVEG
ncbi:hypothetical protein BKA00_006420 [Actinomadura coerulea]|jgi:hypothetical protein|uniref:Uncharacterized protein n=1 Tax=Actinomadura coerulea TaxID=46159 RepID=A0A7X0G769_9ACTN|nr:hypothetical protein [Actinomadura coerulea]GGQ13253.1 hypothetical protein GCM10010187_31990 [Actinomadura coerulea]